MDRDKRSAIVSYIVAVGLAIVVLLFFMLVFGARLYLDDPYPYGILLFCAIFMILFYLQIFVHELGHVIFGKLSGYRFMAMSVFGICIIRDGGKLRRAHFPLMGAAGGTLCLPGGGYKSDTPYKMMLMGGAFMNLLVAGICMIVIIMYPHPFLNIFMLGGVMTGIFVAVPNLIPFTSGLMVNDAMMLRLFEKEDASKHCVYYGQMRMFALLTGKDHTLVPAPEDLPQDNRLADAILFTLAEDDLNLKRFDAAEKKFAELLGNFEEGSTAHNLVNLHILLINELNGAGREVIDSIYSGKMKKFVDTYGRAIPVALLFRVSYEKRFGDGSVDVDRLVRTFYKLVKKNEMAKFEKEVMASLLADNTQMP